MSAERDLFNYYIKLLFVYIIIKAFIFCISGHLDYFALWAVTLVL